MDVLGSGDDGEEMRRGFLKRNEDLINHETVLKLLKVKLKVKYRLPSRKVLNQR